MRAATSRSRNTHEMPLNEASDGSGVLWSTRAVFLSYRVAADTALCERLYDKLRARGLRVWWDRKCLPQGRSWEEGFADALIEAALFVPILSKDALAPFADLTPSSACDNFLLEHRLALELEHHDADHGRLVLPILRGELAELGTLGECYGDFFKDEGVPACPEVVVDTVESKLAEHLERAGKGAVRGAPKTVKESLVKILGHQGVFVKGPRIDAVDGAVKEIVRAAYWVERTSSEVMSPTPHREHHPRERESSFDTETVAEATSLPSPFASCSTSPAPSTMPSTVPSTAPSRNVSMDLADPSREVSGGG